MLPSSSSAMLAPQVDPEMNDTRQIPASSMGPPTQDMASLALTIVRSLPEGQSIEEYIAGLQRCIKQAPKAQAKTQNYIDTFEYWRDQCTNLILEKKALEERIFELEHPQLCNSLVDPELNSSQESQTTPAEFNELAGRVSSRKRKFIEDIRGNGIKIKEPCLHAMANDPFHKLSCQILKIGRNRAHLEAISKSTASVTEIDELSNFTSKLISVLDSTITEVCLAVRFTTTNDSNKRMLDILEKISDQVVLSFISSFRALEELCRTILGRRKRGRIIYQMSMFFDKALELLHRLSGLQIEYENTTEQQYAKRKRPRLEEVEYAANKYLARTLATIIYNLDWNPNQSVHSELLEGILYVVLEHTGKLLSESVFGEHVAASKNPGNITEHVAGAVPNGVSKHETRYFVHVLQSALGGQYKEVLFLRVLAAGKKDLESQERLSGSGTISVRTGDLLAKAKILLQSTLLKTALGCDELATFSPPLVTTEVPELPKDDGVGEMYGSEWFLEAVWDLIGWDLVL